MELILPSNLSANSFVINDLEISAETKGMNTRTGRSLTLLKVDSIFCMYGPKCDCGLPSITTEKANQFYVKKYIKLVNIL